MAQVKVKLGQRSWVNGETREAGSIVELDEKIAESFGTVVDEKPGDRADKSSKDKPAS